MACVWTEKEDAKLRELVAEYGSKKWSLIAQKLGSKGSKQIRRRWNNVLNADNKQGGWSLEEDRVLLEGHQKYGNKWTKIAEMVGGRTDNAVKNRWHALCKRGDQPPGSRRSRTKRAHAEVRRRGRASVSPAPGSDEEDTVSSTSGSEDEGEAARGSGPRDTSSHLDGGADCPSTSAAQAADTPPPSQPVLDMQPAQDHHHHHPKRPKLANRTSMDVSITPGTDPSLTCTGFLRRGCAPHRSKSLENPATKSSSPPSRYQDLTLLIPNGAADPPPPAASMEVRVFKDMLSPAERQHAQELNGMDIPLQINIEDAPLTTSRQAQQEALNALLDGSPANAGGPLTLTGYVPPGGLLTSSSTGGGSLPSVHLLPSASGQPDQFNELLRWISCGTPPSSKPSQVPNAILRTPRSNAGGPGSSRMGAPGQSPAPQTRSRAGQQHHQQQQLQQQLLQQEQHQQQQQQQHLQQHAGYEEAHGHRAEAPNCELGLGQEHLSLLGRLFGSAQQAINSASPSPVNDVCGSACMLGPSHPISPVGSGTADPGAAPGTTDWHAFKLQEQQQQHLVQTAPANTNSSEYKGSGAEGGCLWQQHHQHNHQQEQQHQQQQQQQHHPGPLGSLPLQIPIQGPLAQGSMAGRPSESVWQHIDVLTTPSLSGPELSLLLDALNSTS